MANILGEDEEIPKSIIFCRTRNDCSRVFLYLHKQARQKTSVTMYHSSLTQTTKREVERNFKTGEQLRCLSATVAFGMVQTIIIPTFFSLLI